jgi:hypothetical protein
VRWSSGRGAVVLTGLAAASAVGAYVVTFLAGDADGRRRLALVTVGAVLALVGILLAAIERSRRERAIRTAEQIALDAEVDLMLTLNGALAPLTSYLGELAAAPDPHQRRALLGQVRQAVVDAAVRLTGEGSRSALYEADAGPTTLTRVAWAGRSDLPREHFVAGTPDGDFVLDLVADGDLVFVDDVERHPLVTPSTDGYATVVAVAVSAGPLRLGMLTVDAPRSGDISATDVELVRVLANLLGAGMAAA